MMMSPAMKSLLKPFILAVMTGYILIIPMSYNCALAQSPEEGQRFSCNICREGGELTNPNALLFGLVPLGFGLTCGQVQGIAGPFGFGLTLEQCGTAQALARNTCGCPNEPSQAPALSPATISTGSPTEGPEFVFCTVCFSGDPTFETIAIGGIQCGEWDAKARKKEYTTQQCLAIQTAAAVAPGDPCFCLKPTAAPSAAPSPAPSSKPSSAPSTAPSAAPSRAPSSMPSSTPSEAPSVEPSNVPSNVPSLDPTDVPSNVPSDSAVPSNVPSLDPSPVPSMAPSVTVAPSLAPSVSAAPTMFCEPPPLVPPSSTMAFTCGGTDNRNGITVTLTDDVVCNPGSTFKSFGGNGVVLDCGGNKIIVSDLTGSANAVQFIGSGTIIRNCVIVLVNSASTTRGLVFQTPNGSTSRVDNVSVRGAGIGLRVSSRGASATITFIVQNSDFSYNSDNGILARSNGRTNLNLNNVMANCNAGIGLFGRDDLNAPVQITNGDFCDNALSSGVDVSLVGSGATGGPPNIRCTDSTPSGICNAACPP